MYLALYTHRHTDVDVVRCTRKRKKNMGGQALIAYTSHFSKEIGCPNLLKSFCEFINAPGCLGLSACVFVLRVWQTS
jgi:hypothetical protein